MILSLLYHVDPQKLVKRVILESKEEEKQVKITLVSLDRNFSLLMVAVRSSLDHKLQHQQLVLVDFIRWIEHRMKWVGELSDITDLNELFKKLHPYFDFIDCELIVDMSEEFLNECFNEDKKSLVSELKEHIAKAESFRCSSTVKELKDKLKTIYSPHLTDLSNMPQIQLELHNPWNEAAIEGLYLLIQHLLPHRTKQSILKYIEIETGSVRIKYIVHESKADCLISYAQGKLQFMRLIGIFGLTINGEPILEDDENMNFTFGLALLEAANAGHDEAIEFLLKLGFDVDHCNEKGRTAIMLASAHGHKEIIQTLVSSGGNVNMQDNKGWTALMLASLNGHAKIIEELLKEHADINIRNKNEWTALMMASLNGHTQVVENLIKEHADVNLQNNEGMSALMIASENGHTQIVELLVKEHENINAQTNDGWTALMLASQDGHTDVVQVLLNEHAVVNIQTDSGWTALMLASQDGHTEVVEQLLKEHVDVNVQTKNGWTALMIASANGHVQVVELLAKELVDIDVQMKDGYTALMLACYYKHLEVAECLLRSHADPHIIAYDGSTAFSLAAYSGNKDLVNMLLDKAEPTIDEIENAVVLSGYQPTHITFL